MVNGIVSIVNLGVWNGPDFLRSSKFRWNQLEHAEVVSKLVNLPGYRVEEIRLVSMVLFFHVSAHDD